MVNAVNSAFTGASGSNALRKQSLYHSFLLVCSVLCGFHPMEPHLVCGSSVDSQRYERGVSAQHVVALDKESFKGAISDPANAFWFLKFFAPWYVFAS